MYSKYFGCKEPPFSIAPDPRYLYMSKSHKEALAHLVYGVRKAGGFVLLTGEVGTGKTTICRCLLEKLPKRISVAFILNPKVTVEELLATICDEFEISYPEGNRSIKVFIDKINEYLLFEHATGRQTVLLIDEAQNLTPDVLEQIRLLTNLETNKRKLLQIILLAQPELTKILSQPEMVQLAQRITARYHLGPLDKKDVKAYVLHRLSVAELSNKLFPNSCLNKLYHLSGGVPRLINVLCDRALLGAYVEEKECVSDRILAKAAIEVFGRDWTSRLSDNFFSRWPRVAALTAVGAAVVLAIFLYQQPQLLSLKGASSEKKEVSASVKVRPEVKKQAVKKEPEKVAAKPVKKAEPAAKKTPEKIKEKQTLSSLNWPEDAPIEQSRSLAYQQVLRLWRVPYRLSDGAACVFAESHGLSCLFRQGSVDDLRTLNRPAVLKFFTADKKEYFAALTALDKRSATFTLGGRIAKVSVKEFALRWTGDYSLLWKPPTGYVDSIYPGYEGPEVEWIAAQLAKVKGEKYTPGKTKVYDELLRIRVKEFQFAEGLAPDGVAGIQTLVHLNTKAGNKVPVLVSDGR